MIYFIKGRLKYNDKGSAPFPTILMIFNERNLLPICDTLTQQQLEAIPNFKYPRYENNDEKYKIVPDYENVIEPLVSKEMWENTSSMVISDFPDMYSFTSSPSA